MRFLVLIEAHGAVVGKEADRALREAVGPQIQQLMQSGKVVEAGFMTDRRGSFFLLDIDAADELYSLLGPEIYGHFSVQASPIASIERGAQLLQEWGAAGR